MSDQQIFWMVRSGEGAFLFEDFKQKKIVAIGWNEVGNLSNIHDYEHIKILVKEKYPGRKEGTINIYAGQIWKFRSQFQKGHKVVTYDPENRAYLLGDIESDYEYNPELCEYYHIRRVNWWGQVNRDDLSTSTKNTLGAISTIFELGNDVGNELINVFHGNKAFTPETSSEDTQLESMKEDLEAKAREFIKDRVTKLSWEEMQELVAGILRAMGYKTYVSPKGADRGNDIRASPDGLGLEEPRIVVEVKHRDGQMGSHEVRSFIGGLRQGHKAIYVSTGGFSKEAKYEAERSIIPLTLVDSDVLVQLIIDYYDKFDVDTQTLIPLTKMYWPT